MIRAHPLAGPLLLALAPLVAAAPEPQGVPAGIPRDNFRGRWMHHETAPTDPLLFLSGSPRFFTLNQPGSRVLEFALGSMQKLIESPAGPGLVSLAQHPVTLEIWAVDRVTSSVSVVQRADGRILRTIRVGAEPHGIVFSESGDRAYVTCSAVDRVDVIDTATYAVVNQIAIPAKNPRAIARIDSTVYVAAFLSGNGSATRGNDQNGRTDDVVEVCYPASFPNTQPLPDRDLFAIPVGPSPATDALDPAGTVSGLGTVLFNLRRRPGTQELWIPNTEALNALHRGEKSFVQGQVVANRISIVAASASGNALVDVVDLDALAPNPSLRCAAPTDVAFTPDGARAFVCGYGSDSIAVLSTTSGQVAWLGTIRIAPSTGYPDGAGPRCLGVDPTGAWLVVFNKGENSITRIVLASLPQSPNFEYTAPAPVALGWDPTPADVVQGRIHFIRTANSKSFTSACSSCHVDGHIDGLAWDLGVFLDPEGTPDSQLAFPVDAKGPLVTQSVRRLKEVGPYHWRGERRRLVDFNDTFVNLMEREEGGVPMNLGPDFRYITQYMEHLTIPPNPRQQADRSFTDDEQRGADMFVIEPVLGTLTCASCHGLPLGTMGEIVDNLGGGFAPATDVPALRGIADKLSPPFQVGGDFGTRTELGAGLGHGGALATIQDLLLQPLPPPQTGQRFDVTPEQADLLTAFLAGFDTGLAPTATRQATVHAGNAPTFYADELALLLDAAADGHCDVVYRFGPEDWLGSPTWFTGTYDAGSGRFRQASMTLPPLLPADLVAKGASGVPVTFLGVPKLSGWPMGIDRDNDKLLDLDEVLQGTNPEEADTDGDEFHDGYELQWGMDPLVPNGSSPDQEPPQVVGPVRIIYTTTNAVKFEFETDEQARIIFYYNDSGPVLRAPLKPRYDDEFSEILAELEPSTYHQVRMEMEDLSGNIAQAYFEVYTAGPASPAPARIEDIALRVVDTATGAGALRARVMLGFGGGAPAPGYQIRAAVYYRSDDETILLLLDEVTARTGAAGEMTFGMALPKDLIRGVGKLHFVVLEVVAPPGAPIHARGEDEEGNSVSVAY